MLAPESFDEGCACAVRAVDSRDDVALLELIRSKCRTVFFSVADQQAVASYVLCASHVVTESKHRKEKEEKQRHRHRRTGTYLPTSGDPERASEREMEREGGRERGRERTP